MKNTTKEEQVIAKNSLKDFQNLSKTIRSSKNKGIRISVQETGEFLTIPKKALSLLSDIIEKMAEGKSISIVPSNSELSTQQAADILQVSRPHLIKLLECKEIPFRKVGSHRRIFHDDIFNYKKKLIKNREEQLEFLSNQAQDLNLGYE